MDATKIKTYCSHCEHWTGDSLITTVDSDQFMYGANRCMATPIKQERDQVTGRGIGSPYEDCYRVNVDGNCPKFSMRRLADGSAGAPRFADGSISTWPPA